MGICGFVLKKGDTERCDTFSTGEDVQKSSDFGWHERLLSEKPNVWDGIVWNYFGMYICFPYLGPIDGRGHDLLPQLRSACC